MNGGKWLQSAFTLTAMAIRNAVAPALGKLYPFVALARQKNCGHP